MSKTVPIATAANRDPAAEPVCLITGGSSGVGLATARVFLKQNHRVFICGRSQERLDAAVAQLHKENAVTTSGEPHLQTLAADIGQSGGPGRLVDAAVRTWGRIDVLVNCAAAAPLAPLEQLDSESIDSALAANVSGLFELCRAVWPVMQGQGSGNIVLLSSQATVDPFPGFSLYGASKAFAEALVLSLAREGKESGIRVYGVRPGAVETPMLRGLFADFPAESTLDPNDVAELIFACCRDAFRFSSGQVVSISRQ